MCARVCALNFKSMSAPMLLCSLLSSSSYTLRTNHLACGFKSCFYSEVCFKYLSNQHNNDQSAAMPFADWFDRFDDAHYGLTSDVRITQIFRDYSCKRASKGMQHNKDCIK